MTEHRDRLYVRPCDAAYSRMEEKTVLRIILVQIRFPAPGSLGSMCMVGKVGYQEVAGPCRDEPG